MKIEYLQRKDPGDEEPITTVCVNNIHDPHSVVEGFSPEEQHGHRLTLKSKQVLEELSKDSPSNLFLYFESLDLSKWGQFDFFDECSLTVIPDAIWLEFDIQPYKWKYAWSVSEFLIKVYNLLKADGRTEFTVDGQEYRPETQTLVEFVMICRCEIGFNIKDSNRSLQRLLDDAELYITHVINSARLLLQDELSQKSITTYFDFPEEIRAPCEQYLMYFSQFLLDVGLKADTEMKEEAARVMFKVTPADEETALDQIREALACYVAAATDERVGEYISKQEGVAARQLESNVFHLKGQLSLVNAQLEMKNATIEALKFSNFQMKEKIKEQPPKLLPTEDSDSEKIFGDTVEITPYKGNGFNIDLPKIARLINSLKRW